MRQRTTNQLREWTREQPMKRHNSQEEKMVSLSKPATESYEAVSKRACTDETDNSTIMSIAMDKRHENFDKMLIEMII